MSLNNKLTKIGLYLLSKEASESDLSYLLVGGLAVQAYSHSQFSKYHRPTFDADISTPNLTYKKFRKQYGDNMAKFAKNKFGLGSHVEDSHNANTLRLIQHSPLNQKSFFWLHFNRYQKELYEKIKDKIFYDIENNSLDFSLPDLGVTNKSIRDNLSLRVLKPEEVLRHKLAKVSNKSNRLITKISPDFNELREKIIETGLSFKSKKPLNSLYEQILISYTTDDQKYYVEKDIYDVYLLTKILS